MYRHKMMSRLFHARHVLLPNGWRDDVLISVVDGMVTAVTPDSPCTPNAQRLGIVIPGIPNLHSHAFQRGMAGLAETRGEAGISDSFWTWRAVMYRFLDRLTPDDMLAIAALAYAEMLETGFTRVGEFHYLHHETDGRPYAQPAAMATALAEAAREIGIAMTLLPVFYAHAGFGGATPGKGQRRFLCTIDQYARLRADCGTAIAGLPDAVLGAAPHSLRAVTPDELTAVLDIARDGPVHIHIAEQTAEVEACRAWSGQAPVAWLLDHVDVDRRWCLVHATHMDADEAQSLAHSGAVAGLCPVTEANLGDGLFPAAPFLAAGGVYGVGSDSNVLIDAAEELRWLEYGQRLARQGRSLMARDAGASTGGAMFRASLAGGAQALGALAGIAVGASADWITLDAAHPSLLGRTGDALLDGWIFAAGRAAIDGVWRRGAQVVSGGRHVARDAIHRRYADTLARLV